MIRISFLYAAILGLIFVGLSLRVIKSRFGVKVSLGHGGDAKLNIAIRTHANFAEYIPLALILLAGVEAFNYPIVIIHTLGIFLILGRLLHIYGLNSNNSIGKGRPAGTVLTLLTMVVASILIFIRASYFVF